MPDTFIKIASVTVGSGGSSTVSFSAIPSTYTDLLVKVSARISNSDSTWTLVQFNGDTTNGNYAYRYLEGNGTTPSTGSFSSSAGVPGGSNNFASATSNTFGNSDLYIANYTSSNQKSSLLNGVTENNATAAYQDFSGNKWSGSSAISSMTFTAVNSGTFAQYSTFTLYGIKNS